MARTDGAPLRHAQRPLSPAARQPAPDPRLSAAGAGDSAPIVVFPLEATGRPCTRRPRASRSSNGNGAVRLTAKGCPWLEAATGCEAVGLICALIRPQSGVVGLGYWVVPPERGHGYARRAVGLLATWILNETEMTRVEALVEPDNLASRRTLEQCAFQEEGCLRSVLDGKYDAIMYSLLRADLSV